MSSATVNLAWKVVSVLRDNPPVDQSNIVFNVSPNQGLYSQFDVRLDYSYVPKLLVPTAVYHQKIRHLLREKGFEVQGKKLPYTLQIPDIGLASLNLKIRLFPPNILSLTVRLSGFSAVLDPHRLIDLQRLNRLVPLNDIVQWTVGMAETLNQREFDRTQPYQFRPALHLDGVCPPEAFAHLVKSQLTQYVGILIRNHDYDLMDDDIPTRMVKKNQFHNLKSSQELLLLDKQGILYLTPASGRDPASRTVTFTRAHDLYEIAFVFGAYLDEYSGVRAYSQDFADFLLCRMQPWIEDSGVIFSSSVTNNHIWDLLKEEFRLQTRLAHVTKDQGFLGVLDRRDLFDRFASDWWTIPDFAGLLARRIEESRGFSLGFLENEDLRHLIVEDYGEARRSFQVKNYKATMLLCGSIAEALLTAVLDKAKPSGVTTRDLYEDFNLHKLIQSAKELGLITDQPLLLHLDALRNYRNMIHPGVQIRRSLLPDASKATIALETVSILVKELNRASAS